MYIQRKITNYKTIPLRENVKLSTNNDWLFEAAHAFDKQYDWAWKIAEEIYNGILRGSEYVKVTLEQNNTNNIDGVIVKIDTGSIMETSAKIKGFNKFNYCVIDIFVNQFLLTKDKNIIINDIWKAITHELGHSYTNYKHNCNTKSLCTIDKDYSKWIDVINDNKVNPNSTIYLFCYALYSTNYQEVQAFVSETYSSVMSDLLQKYNDISSITKKEFTDVLINTDIPQIYKTNTGIADILINSLIKRQNLSNSLKYYNLNYSPEDILKKCNNIKKKSYGALNDAYNNAYQHFYNSFNK